MHQFGRLVALGEVHHQLFAAVVLAGREVGFEAIGLVVYLLQRQCLGTAQRSQISR